MRLAFLFLISFGLFGCSSAIEDFVSDPTSAIENVAPAEEPPNANSDLQTVSISGGNAIQSTGTTNGGSYRLSPSRIEATATTVGARYGIQKSRVARP